MSNVNTFGTQAAGNAIARAGLAAVAASLLIGSAIAQDTLVRELVIDDFTSGPDLLEPFAPDYEILYRYQSGTMIGNSRRINFFVKESPYGDGVVPAGKLSVQPEHGLLSVSTDYRTIQRMGIRYEIPEAAGGMNERDFTLFDGMTLEFQGIDLGLNINVILCSNDCGKRAQHGINVNRGNYPTVGGAYPVKVDFPFSNFRSPQPGFDLSNVRYVFVIVQTGNAFHADDYALSRVVARVF